MQTKTKRKTTTRGQAPRAEKQARVPEIPPEREDQIRVGLERRKPKAPLRSATDLQCPVCDRGTLVPSESLTVDWVENGERTVIGNLAGFVCSNCSHRLFDAASSRVISRYLDQSRPRGGYTATISSLGGGKLGIYLPRDVLRNVDLARNDVVYLYPVSRKKLVIESQDAAG